MNNPLKVKNLNAPAPSIDFSKLSKDRLDWLEVFGNQWPGGLNPRELLTPEERAELKKPIFPVFLREHE